MHYYFLLKMFAKFACKETSVEARNFVLFTFTNGMFKEGVLNYRPQTKNLNIINQFLFFKSSFSFIYSNIYYNEQLIILHP